MSFDHLRDVCSAARSLSFQLNYSTAPDIHNLLLPVFQPAPAISLFWSAKIFALWSPKPWPALVHPWWLVEPEGQEEEAEASSCWYGGSGWEGGGFRSLMICEGEGVVSRVMRPAARWYGGVSGLATQWWYEPRKQDGSIPALPGQRLRKYFESFKFKGEREGAMTPAASWFCPNVLIRAATISWLTREGETVLMRLKHTIT